jgi:hypothetical protein
MADSTRIFLLPNQLFFEPYVVAIRGAKRRIQIATYLFKTGYAERTRANVVAEELIAAVRDRGVSVEVVLDNGRRAPQVSAANWVTAQLLAAGGVQVRMGPANEIWHEKITLIDDAKAFVGSHNLTRGGLTHNLEASVCTDLKSVVDQMKRFVRDLWAQAYPLDVATPAPVMGPPLEISLLNVTDEADRLVLTFAGEHTENVDAFAAVAGGRMGPTVPPTERTAWVRPNVEPGEWVSVVVRAYSYGETLATSDSVRLIYQPTDSPTGPPPESEGESEGEGAETSPGGFLAAPTLHEATQVSDTTVRLRWAFAGLTNFLRFVIEQQDGYGNWQHLAPLRDPAAREWTGAPLSMDTSRSFRVLVYNTAEESVASEEEALTG